MPVVEAAGGRIAYDEHGQGEAVLFVSGLGGMAAFWAAQVEAFRPSFRVLTFDHRGSDEAKARRLFGVLWAGDVIAILDHAGAQHAHLVRPFHRRRHRAIFAVTYPGRVQSLALGGTWLAPDRRFRDQFAFRKEGWRRSGAVLTTCWVI